MSKSLVLFFSVYESTKAVAREIAAQTGADLVEIEPVTPYDSNRNHYNSLARYAKKEHDEDMRPAIKNEIDVDGYDNIFIGYPMWWYTFPMIIYTLFDEYARSPSLSRTQKSSKAYQSKCRKRSVIVKIK